MKDLLIVVGGASVIFGVYLAMEQKKKSSMTTKVYAGTAGAGPTAAAEALIVGPSMTSSAGSAVNNIDPVVRYDASKVGMFPATTEIIIPGGGSLDGLDTTNMHQIVQF